MTWLDNVYNAFWGVTGDIAGLVSAVMKLPWMIGDILMSILQVLLYPLFAILTIVINALNFGMTVISTFFGYFISFGNSLYSVVGVFNGTFPSTWMTLLGIIIAVNVFLRVYTLIPVFGRK